VTARPRYVIAPDERVAIVGRTGSGKTTLAARLVGGYSSLVALDPKHRLALAGADGAPLPIIAAADFARWWPHRGRRFVVRPDPDGEAWGAVDALIRRVLRYGSTALYVDEALDYAEPGRIVPAYRRAIVTGREAHVPVISCAQRPRSVHNVVLSEAEHLFVFDLALDTDRAKVAAIGGADLRRPPGAAFSYWYAGPATGGRPVLCPPLDLGR
jgi:DNA helicase HerA-like ATPase